jgi:hypothetical protein
MTVQPAQRIAVQVGGAAPTNGLYQNAFPRRAIKRFHNPTDQSNKRNATAATKTAPARLMSMISGFMIVSWYRGAEAALYK